MRDLSHIKEWHKGGLNEGGGAFVLRVHNVNIYIIVSWTGEWDHVSVSLKNRCPTWAEMDYIRKMFFEPEELVIQYHPPDTNKINVHHNCLHLWRPHDNHIKLPPEWMV